MCVGSVKALGRKTREPEGVENDPLRDSLAMYSVKEHMHLSAMNDVTIVKV